MVWNFIQRNLFFASNSNFLITISLQPGGVKPLIFQNLIFGSNRSRNLKRSTTLHCNDIWIRKSKLVARTQFLLNYICADQRYKYCITIRTRLITLFGSIQSGNGKRMSLAQTKVSFVGFLLWERNSVFSTNSSFLILTSLINLWYFKLRLLKYQRSTVLGC